MTKSLALVIALGLPLGPLAACCAAPIPAPERVVPGDPDTPDGPDAHALRPPRGGPGGGIAIDQAFPPERLALGHGYSIVVLTVVATDPRGAATHGDPPAIVVNIEEVLAGGVAPGQRPGQWSPPPSGIDWTGPSAAAAKAEWAQVALAAPPVGLRVIALGREVDGVFRVSAKLREPFSDAGKATWLERIDAERARRD